MPSLKIKVKQGEEIGYGFTINQIVEDESGNKSKEPLDLSEYKIVFQVKKSPLEKTKPFIYKEITTDSDYGDVGYIYEPTNGKFAVHLTKEDTSNPIGDYSLVISMVQRGTNDIISSNYCNGAEFIICEQ